jgi:sporulation protein YlmC with PRC-barrel domain
MLHTAKTLRDYTLDSLDGEMGRVNDFYFDDEHWTVRYLVADTGNWLRGRLVLISPYALVAAIKDEEHIAVDLTKSQIEESPSISTDKPVSRQFEADYHEHYGWGAYWGGPFAWGAYAYPYPGPASVTKEVGGPSVDEEKEWDPHLRSVRNVTGYHIEASDGEIGHVEDFVIDDATWAIRYLIVDTRNWWPGKKVLISPHWIDRVSWSDSKVFVNLTRDAIKQAPEYSDDSVLNREYEAGLHGHYGREGYWTSEESARKPVTPNS